MSERRFAATLEELFALPENAVILSEQGGVYARALEGPGAVWRETGFREKRWPEDISLPALILWLPTDG